jgi:hypothetical protein
VIPPVGDEKIGLIRIFRSRGARRVGEMGLGSS